MVIKDCPFCGSECRVLYTTFGDNPTECYRVHCKDEEHCLDEWDDTEEDAIKTWNQRPDIVTKEDDLRKTIEKWNDLGLLDKLEGNLDENLVKLFDCELIQKVYVKTIPNDDFDKIVPDPPPFPKARRIHNEGFTIKDE